MSLRDIRSECSEVAGELQPYVDGELEEDEQEAVAAHLEGCRACRSAVSEQMWVRTTLRLVEREQAPQSLRARIQQGLDAVDAERLGEQVSQGWWSAARVRLRDLMRGGMVMVPAGAVAMALFFVARQGMEPAQTVPTAGIGSAVVALESTHEAPEDLGRMLAEVEPQLDFPVQIARPAQHVELVGARVDPKLAGNAESPGARLRYRVLEDGEATGYHLIDHQHAAHPTEAQAPRGRSLHPQGSVINYMGRQYVLDRENDAPAVHFVQGGVAHVMSLEGRPRLGSPPGIPAVDGLSPDFSLLLQLADQTRLRATVSAHNPR